MKTEISIRSALTETTSAPILASTERLRRRCVLATRLATTTTRLVPMLFVSGAAVIVARVSAPEWWVTIAAIAGAATAVATGLAWCRPVRSPSASQIAAFFDTQLGAGGMVMTLAECPNEPWGDQLVVGDSQWAHAIPGWNIGVYVRRLMFPIGFVAISMFVPLRAPAKASTPAPLRQAVVESLREKLEKLAAAHAVEPGVHDELKAEIDKLMKESEVTPLSRSSWETIDTLEQRMETQLTSGTAALAQAQDRLNRLEMALADLASLSPEERETLEQTLQASLEGLLRRAAPSLEPGDNLDDQKKALEAIKARLGGNAAERKEALKDLRELLANEAKKLAELRAANGDEAGASEQQQPGGIGRGRNDADLHFGDEDETQSAKFREMFLPPGEGKTPHDDVVRESFEAPEVKPGEMGARSGEQITKPTTSTGAYNRRIAPRHRDVVQKFFSRAP